MGVEPGGAGPGGGAGQRTVRHGAGSPVEGEEGGSEDGQGGSHVGRRVH